MDIKFRHWVLPLPNGKLTERENERERERERFNAGQGTFPLYGQVLRSHLDGDPSAFFSALPEGGAPKPE